jgi:hypothetical protein
MRSWKSCLIWYVRVVQGKRLPFLTHLPLPSPSEMKFPCGPHAGRGHKGKPPHVPEPRRAPTHRASRWCRDIRRVHSRWCTFHFTLFTLFFISDLPHWSVSLASVDGCRPKFLFCASVATHVRAPGGVSARPMARPKCQGMRGGVECVLEGTS